jgi:hypothetical protein
MPAQYGCRPTHALPAFIQIEILKERVSACIHIGRAYRMVDVKTCGDVLRVVEVFEGVKT